MGNTVLVNQAISAGAVAGGAGAPDSTGQGGLKYFEQCSWAYQKAVVKAVFRSSGADEHRPLNEIFEDFEKQENENQNENWKRNLIKELNELHTAGLSTPDYFTQDLKETRFEKYFRVVARGKDEGEEFYRMQYMKFFVMYSYIRPFYDEEEGSKDSFYSSLAKLLEDTDDGGESVYSFEMGISLTFTLLEELRAVAPAVLEKALQNIYQAITQLKTGMLREDDYKFYAREEVLNRHREYLLKLARDENVTQTAKAYAIRLLIVVGNLRSSGEDYLVAYNVIQEQGLKINLDAEFALNNSLQEDLTAQDAEQPTFVLNQRSSSEITFMTGLETDVNMHNHTSLTFDDKYIYADNEHVGMFKIGYKKSISVAPGFVYHVNPQNVTGAKRSMMHLNGRLYCRDDQSQTKDPLRYVDKDTLDFLDTEEFKAKVAKNQRNLDEDDWNKKVLEVTDGDYFEDLLSRAEHQEYRSVLCSPIFTDGQYIYIISSHYAVKEDHAELANFEVEAYCPQTWRFVKAHRLIFEPEELKGATPEQEASVNEDTELAKSAFLGEGLLSAVCATNGKTFAVGLRSKMFFFDLETGVRHRDWISIPDTSGAYDPFTNTFWFYKENTQTPTLQSLKVDGFHNRAELDELQAGAKPFRQIIKERTLDTYEKQRNKQHQQKPRQLETFLKRLGRPTPDAELVPEAPENDDINYSLYLIMYTLNKGCENMDTVIADFDKLYPNLTDERLRCQCKLFRSPYAVSVSATFVRELTKMLERVSSFTDNDMTGDNVLEQYQFLWLIKLVHRFVRSLERLNLSLSEVEEDSTVRARFGQLVDLTTAKLAEEGINPDRLKVGNSKDEEHKSTGVVDATSHEAVQAIWAECTSECRGIQNVLLNLTSESNDDLISKIKRTAAAIKEGSITPSLIMFLKFLATSDSAKSLVHDGSLGELFDVCCDEQAQKLADHLGSLTLKEKYEEIEYSEFEEARIIFMDSFVKNTLISVFVIHSKIVKAIEKDQKKKVDKLKAQADEKMQYFTKIYNKVTFCAQGITRMVTEVTEKIMAEAISKHESDNQDKEKPSSKAKDMYVAYQEHIYEAIVLQNRFFDFVNICINCLASEKEHKMTRHLNSLCRKSIDILTDLGKFCTMDANVHKSSMKIDADLCKLREKLSDDLMRSMIWSLSKIAHSFIKIKQQLKKPEEDEADQKLLKAKVLSGGMENRFLSTFSKETLNTIENLATITGDKQLIKYLTGVELIDEDEVMLSIINQGKDENVDRLINLLQWNLTRRQMQAKAGGAEGMTVSRCAFAATLSLNNNDESCSYTNFVMMVDQLEMSMEMVDEGAPENQKNKQLMEELKSLGNIEPILDRWEIASKMRIWLQDKRKDISNNIKKKADAEHKRKEEEEKLIQDAQAAKEETKTNNGADDEEETIDTTSKKDKTTKVEPISEEELRRREKEQVTILVKKVIDKAELLIKLATPPAWDQPDTSNKNLRAIDGYTEDEEPKDENLLTKLRRIQQIQASTGTITSYENLSNKEIFTSCASSVLACLQCNLTAKNILKAIENKYISAMERYCGLRIMGELASCYMNDSTKISCFNWFCSALRHNTNILAHYSDDLSGMGEHLLDKCRISFFEVYNGIVKQLKATIDKETIEFLLNCLKWRIGATDHQYILKSGIIQTLKAGNGETEREKNPIKYSWGHAINFSENADCETLSYMVLDTLEFIMTACFSRILGEGEDKDLNLQKSGSSIQKIQQAYSLVNTNITEVLLASSFEIIFEQLTRYTKLIESSDPIDWKLYVAERNRMRINNENLDAEGNAPLEDEKTEEEKAKEADEEQKQIEEEEKKLAEEAEQNGVSRDKVREVLDRQKTKEIKKIHAKYDDDVTLKLLRLLEIFTAIALKNKQIHQFVLQVTRPVQISTLIHLLLNCQPKHGMATLKIFNNLIKIGIETGTLDESFKDIEDTPWGKKLYQTETKVRFEDCPFLQFCYNLLLYIRSSQWDKRRLQSYGAYNISCGIVRLLKIILRSDFQPAWRNAVEEVLDDFLSNVDSYPIEEFDVLISLFEGGEFNGLNMGAYGTTQDNNKFITVGFVKQWYDLSNPDGQNSDNDFKIHDIETQYSSKDDYLLAIYYDEKHPERNDMFLAIPDEVTLISNLYSTTHDYLLNKDRLDRFLKAMAVEQAPDTDDPVSLTKRCVGMKILVKHIELYGDEIAKLFDESFRDKFINYLLSECSKASAKEDLSFDWYDQKLYAIKRLATESQNGLRIAKDVAVIFNGKVMSLTVNVEGTQERYSKCFKLKSAMNYGCVAQKLEFKLIDSNNLANEAYRNDNIVVMKGEDINSVEKLEQVFKHVDVIVTSDLDLKTMHDSLKEAKNDKLAYFKSIILIDETNFDGLQSLLRDGPKMKIPDTKGLDDHQSLCKELETFCGFEKSKLDEIFKENENEPLTTKVKLLAQNCKKDDKKEEDKKDEKEEDEKELGEIDESLTQLSSHAFLEANMNGLRDFGNNNYNNQSQSKTLKGTLYNKVYEIEGADIIGVYKKTLASLYRTLCRRTLSSFFEQLSLENLLSIILTKKENFEMLLAYIQIRGNDAVKMKQSSNKIAQYDEFLEMFKKILGISAQNKNYIKLLDLVVSKVIMEGTTKILKKAANKKQNDIKAIFKDEASAVIALNLYLLPDTIKYIASEAPELLYERATFSRLLTVLLMIPITFREDKQFHQNIYMTVYKLILPFVQDSEKYNDKDIIQDTLQHQFLKKIFKKLPTNIDPQYNTLTSEQKVLFEIFLLCRILEQNTEGVSADFDYPDCVLDLERSKQILKEMTNFDLISYLVYLEKELTEEERKSSTVVETTHNRYNHKFVSRHQSSNVKKLKVELAEDSKFEGYSSLAVSKDPEGKALIKMLSNIDIEKNNREMDINADTFYLHYPYNPAKTVAFGYGYNYKLGNNECYTTTSNPILFQRKEEECSGPLDRDLDLRILKQRNAYVVMMDENHKLYRCGYNNQWDRTYYYVEQYTGTLPEKKIIDLRCGYNNYAVLTENHEIHIQGYNTSYHLDDTGNSKKELWHKVRPNEEEEKVLHWDVGYDYTVYTTDNGKAYGAGNEFLRGLDLEYNGNSFKEIPFDDGVIPIKPLCNNYYQAPKLTMMFVKNKDKMELWSCGSNDCGMLGQGDGKNESKKFAPLNYDTEKITFAKAQCTYYFAMAITDKGELYGWGQNNYKQLGMNDTKNYYSPTEIPFFRDYYVHDIAVGANIALISASPRADMDTRKLFYTGDIKGVDTADVTNDGVLHIKQFDNLKYKWIECGEEVAYISFEGEKSVTQNTSVHHGYTCEITGQSPIKGTMHFWQSGEKWHFVSEEGYKKIQQEEEKHEPLPALTYATKNYIKDIEKKEWPKIDEKDYLEDSAGDDFEVRYVAHNLKGEEKIAPAPKSKEETIFDPEAHDANPLIFYRYTRPLKDKARLPNLDLDNFFETTELHGFKLTITPDYSYEKNKDIIKLQKDKHNKTVDSIKKFDEKLDMDLLEAIERYISDNAIDFYNNPNTEVEAANLKFSTKELKAKQAKDIQPRINAYLSFNKNFIKVIPFVILDEELIKEVTEGKTEVKADTLTVLFMVSKSMAFRSTKNSYIKKIADSLPTNYDEPEIRLNRRLIQHKKDRGKVDNKGEWTTFGTTMQALKSKNYESLNKPNSSYKSWKATFVGEGSIDAGGPYRESLSNMTDELYSRCLPLLIPTQNHKNDHGLGRDLWTINPSSTAPTHLEMYKFLGALMGMAFRAGHVMDLKFPSIFWKQFVGEPVTLEDLRYSDLYAVQAIKDTEKIKAQSTKEMFVEAMEITWTTQLSNGETVPVCEDGQTKAVGWDDVEEYHKLVLKTRAEEGQKQIQAMREGFELIFPMSVLTILNWRDVEERVRGPSDISAAALKSITEYSNCSSDNDYVKRFWRVFEEFTNEQKSMFLKFVWGRARLPPTERLKDQPFKFVLLDDYRFTEHDTHFPEAHTCFFQFDMPRYTNDEACKSKILYAIEACGEIDTDNSSYSIADDGGNYDTDSD